MGSFLPKELAGSDKNVFAPSPMLAAASVPRIIGDF
jgi:hypothetical protein